MPHVPPGLAARARRPPRNPSMTLFARCFLLVFCQLGVGGLLALAVPPFHDIARGYFKSSGGVFLFCAWVGGGGAIYLRLTRGAEAVGTGEALVWGLFLLLFSAYLASLWTEYVFIRARLYAASLLVGLFALSLSAVGVTPDASWALGTLSVVDAFAGAAALGGVTSGMLIGHWYLIDPGMELEPFHKCFRFFVGALFFEVAVLAVVVLYAWATSGSAPLFGGYGPLAAMRFFLGPVAALGIAALTARVLAIPQTMAATGLFYIATLAVLVGNFLGRYFTFRTGLPL